MSPEQIVAAEEAVRGLVEADVARLLRPVLRPEHVPVIAAVERLPWAVERIEIVAEGSLTILTAAAMPGGLLDPVDDQSDVPWAITLGKLASVPSAGSKAANSWFRHGLHLLFEDVAVSGVHQAMMQLGPRRDETGAHRSSRRQGARPLVGPAARRGAQAGGDHVCCELVHLDDLLVRHELDERPRVGVRRAFAIPRQV
jgi:hypothetical protein